MSRMLKPAAAGLAISSLCSLVRRRNSRPDAGSRERRKRRSNKFRPTRTTPASAGPRQRTTNEARRDPVRPPESQSKLRGPAVERVCRSTSSIPNSKRSSRTGNRTLRSSRSCRRIRRVQIRPDFRGRKAGRRQIRPRSPRQRELRTSASDRSEKGQSQQKLNKNGESYKLESDTPERWVCTGKEVIKIDDKEKTYEKMPDPSGSPGTEHHRRPAAVSVRHEGRAGQKPIQVEASEKMKPKSGWKSFRAEPKTPAIGKGPSSSSTPRSSFPRRSSSTIRLAPKRCTSSRTSKSTPRTRTSSGRDPFAPKLCGYKPR